MGLLLHLEPVNKLVNLKKLTLILTNMNNPLSEIIGNLTNLQELTIDLSAMGQGSSTGYRHDISINLEPINKLTNLRKFWLRGYVFVVDNIYSYNTLNAGHGSFTSYIILSKEQVENINNTLPELEFIYGM